MKVDFCDRCGRQIGGRYDYTELEKFCQDMDEKGHATVPHFMPMGGVTLIPKGGTSLNGNIPLFMDRRYHDGITLCLDCQQDFEDFMREGHRE